MTQRWRNVREVKKRGREEPSVAHGSQRTKGFASVARGKEKGEKSSFGVPGVTS